MQIQLDRSSRPGPGPVYQQIASQIRERIEGGQLGEGDRLPPIRELARSLGVNRDTVALAYDELVSEGVLEATVGRGTFVRQARVEAVGTLSEPALSVHVEGLIDFERARPRYGAASDSVPFHALVPEPGLYPVAGFRRSMNRVLTRSGGELLLYGDRQGQPELRETLAKHFTRSGMQVTADEVTVCQGASQGIVLALRLFTEPGDVVAVEEPTYSNLLWALRGLGLEAAPVRTDETGPDLAALEEVLARPQVKLLYTIPTFHNPMGTTTCLAHRRELLRLAARAGKPVVEDAYEMDLRFAGREVPSLAALDEAGLVVHLYSFSKSLFPGARVGSITARGRAVEGLRSLRAASDLGSSPLMQAAVEDFVSSGAYDRHLSRLRRTLRSRTRTLVDALRAYMPGDVRFTTPEGGYQVWVTLPEEIDTRDLLADATRAGVLFAPGSVFLHDGRPSSSLRLTVAQTDEAAIGRGVPILARVVEERLAAGSNLASRSIQI
jgi:GntR family transcriptional regulator/MocR family aminotransferase